MVAGGLTFWRTPRPGEHKRRTIYERRISRCYARPVYLTIAKRAAPPASVPWSAQVRWLARRS